MYSSLPWWGAALAVALALFVNGWVAEVEDNQPGGLTTGAPHRQEPDGKSPSRAPVRIALVLVLLGIIALSYIVANHRPSTDGAVQLIWNDRCQVTYVLSELLNFTFLSAVTRVAKPAFKADG